MISIRPEKPEDKLAIHEVNTLAFGRADEARLVGELRNSPQFIAELSLVACEEEKIVGHILYSIVKIEKGNRSFPVLSLAPMAVHPDYQRQGIGSELVREGLARARSLGYGAVVVIGHPDYYPRFGFSSASARALQAPFPVPDEAFMVLELSEGAIEGIAGTVKYPPAFDQI
jgi:putative acetyltransferase